jgi:hypothetical protein
MSPARERLEANPYEPLPLERFPHQPPAPRADPSSCELT